MLLCEVSFLFSHRMSPLVVRKKIFGLRKWIRLLTLLQPLLPFGVCNKRLAHILIFVHCVFPFVHFLQNRVSGSRRSVNIFFELNHRGVFGVDDLAEGHSLARVVFGAHRRVLEHVVRCVDQFFQFAHCVFHARHYTGTTQRHKSFFYFFSFIFS